MIQNKYLLNSLSLSAYKTFAQQPIALVIALNKFGAIARMAAQ